MYNYEKLLAGLPGTAEELVETTDLTEDQVRGAIQDLRQGKGVKVWATDERPACFELRKGKWLPEHSLWERRRRRRRKR